MNTYKYKQGDKVDYYSRDYGRWVPAVIVDHGEKNDHPVYTVQLLADGEMYWGYADQVRLRL